MDGVERIRDGGAGKSTPHRHRGAGRRRNAAKAADPKCQEKPRWAPTYDVTVPQTDTGRWGEYPKAHVRMLVQELGKLTP